MTLDCCEVCLAIVVCSIITIVFYLTSFLQANKKEDEEKPNRSSTSDGFQEKEPVSHSEPKENIQYPVHQTGEEHSTGQVISENSDLTLLQNRFIQSHLLENASALASITDDYVKIDKMSIEEDTDPVIHPDSQTGRIQLRVQYDNQVKQLTVQLVNAQGLIRPEQTYAPETILTFHLIGAEQSLKHSIAIVENAPVTWKEPMNFSVELSNVINQTLCVTATNDTDPSVPRDRVISIPLTTFADPKSEINDWFDLQYAQ